MRPRGGGWSKNLYMDFLPREPVAFGVFTEPDSDQERLDTLDLASSSLSETSNPPTQLGSSPGRLQPSCEQICQDQLQILRYGRCNKPMTVESVLLHQIATH